MKIKEECVPVVIFAFNRPEHLSLTLDALRRADSSDQTPVLIFCDGPRSERDKNLVAEVKTIAEGAHGFKSVSVFASETNYGLGASVIRGVDHALSIYDSVIVLEDDVEVSFGFLTYMRDALAEYNENPKVFSISGYLPPIQKVGGTEDVFFIPRICSWGWATWKDRWLSVDWKAGHYRQFIKDRNQKSRFCRAGRDMLDMLINQVEGTSESWAIRFDFGRFLANDGLTLYPSCSLVKNIGMDGSGAHFERSARYETKMTKKLNFIFPQRVSESEALTVAFSKFYPRRLRSRLAIYARRMHIHRPARWVFRCVFR
jgi:glycosyltransferase involved in cell wall biosynthesis